MFLNETKRETDTWERHHITEELLYHWTENNTRERCQLAKKLYSRLGNVTYFTVRNFRLRRFSMLTKHGAAAAAAAANFPAEASSQWPSRQTLLVPRRKSSDWVHLACRRRRWRTATGWQTARRVTALSAVRHLGFHFSFSWHKGCFLLCLSTWLDLTHWNKYWQHYHGRF